MRLRVANSACSAVDLVSLDWYRLTVALSCDSHTDMPTFYDGGVGSVDDSRAIRKDSRRPGVGVVVQVSWEVDDPEIP